MSSSPDARRRLAVSPWLGSAGFAVVGPVLEAGLAPFLITGGFTTGDDLPGGPLPVLGVVLILAGLGVLIDTYLRFAREGRGTPSPLAPPRELVIVGAYRWVRNPQYVATATIIVGEALLLRRAILLPCAALYVLALATLSRYYEEPLLRNRFGADYDSYRAQVPGWLPGARRRHS